MAALHLNDAGTWRRIQNVYVNDAGTWRTIQKVWINDAGTWRQVYTRRPAESGSITVASSGNEIGASTSNFGSGIYGSISGWPGSLGGNRLTDNAALVTIAEDVISHVTRVRIQQLGGAQLANDYFASLTANGNTILGSAATVTYSNPTTTWTWSGQLLNLSSVNGSTIPVTINF